METKSPLPEFCGCNGGNHFGKEVVKIQPLDLTKNKPLGKACRGLFADIRLLGKQVKRRPKRKRAFLPFARN
jgi:hypothetical protein